MDWPVTMIDMRETLRALNATLPEATRDFGTLTSTVKQSGALSVRDKELVALGISIAMRCEPCIGFHVEALQRAGGTREELADVLGVALQMGGGPSLMYAAKTLAAWDQLAEVQAADE